VIVHAMSGAMGGSASEEFLAVAANGEDTFVRSPGGYAANVEAVRIRPADPVPYPAAHVEDTPDTPTIRTLVALANACFPRSDRLNSSPDYCPPLRPADSEDQCQPRWVVLVPGLGTSFRVVTRRGSAGLPEAQS
jgi:hypothetical protein